LRDDNGRNEMFPDLITPIEAKAIRVRDAAKLLGLSRSAFYLQLKNPRFPQGCKLGRARVWLPTDLFAWVQQKSNKGKSH
jgi:predicted DNA-binding transcriptional regulator AlpA